MASLLPRQFSAAFLRQAFNPDIVIIDEAGTMRELTAFVLVADTLQRHGSPPATSRKSHLENGTTSNPYADQLTYSLLGRAVEACVTGPGCSLVVEFSGSQSRKVRTSQINKVHKVWILEHVKRILDSGLTGIGKNSGKPIDILVIALYKAQVTEFQTEIKSLISQGRFSKDILTRLKVRHRRVFPWYIGSH